MRNYITKSSKKMELFTHLKTIFAKFGYSMKCQNTSNDGGDNSSVVSGAYFSFEKLNETNQLHLKVERQLDHSFLVAVEMCFTT